jgi:heat shock protein HslJ
MRYLLILAAVVGCATPAGRSASIPLEHTHWRLMDVKGNPAVAEAEGAREAYLQFGPDSGRVVGSTGCNRPAGTYTRHGEELRFGPAATTRMACLNPQAVSQEQGVLAALRDTERHEISGDTLSLIGQRGTLARFTAVEP